MNIEQQIQNILDRNFTRGDNAKALKELLDLYSVSITLPNKDATICEGYNKAKMQDYKNRNVLKHKDQDDYYSGWMDCYDWISKGN